MPPSTTHRLAFHMEGSSQDGGLVRAQDFVDWLENVLTCLRRLERGRQGKLHTVYRVTSLSLGSAVVELEAASDADSGLTASEVVKDFLIGVEAVELGRISGLPFDAETKTAFASLTAPLRRQLRRVTVTSDRHMVSLKTEQAAIMPLVPRVASVAVSSCSGFVDAVNVHKEPVFYLYPTTGPRRVACAFDATILLDQVRSAIKCYTTVYGTFEYGANSPFPDRIVVDRLHINADKAQLPSLRSLYGCVPSMTSGVDSVTFVRRQRDASS